MPYAIFAGSGPKPFCIYKVDGDGEKTGDTLGCHPSEEQAKVQIQAIGAVSHAEDGKSVGQLLMAAVKNASVGSMLESKVHQSFAVVADYLYGAGLLNREERISLSAAIGKGLKPLGAEIDGLGLMDRPINDVNLLELLSSVKGDVSRDDERMITYGSSLKTYADGRVGGYLVLFSPDGKNKDLTGEYFTKSTNFMWEGKERRIALYNHGIDKTLKKQSLGNGWSFIRVDDIGLWVEMQLDLRNEYEKAIYGLSKSQKLGLSSGTASHMIEMQKSGRITVWPIIEGSFTPTPAEPRTRAITLMPTRSLSLKSLIAELPSGVGSHRGVPKRRGPRRTRRGMSVGSVVRLARRLNVSQHKEIKAMTVEELMVSLKQLVPELSDEQTEQIASILRLGLGEPAVEPEPVEGATEEMRAYFGMGTYIDPWKAAASMDEVLGVIQNVVTLTDEQLEKVTAIIQLALASSMEESVEEPVLEEEEFLEEDIDDEGMEDEEMYEGEEAPLEEEEVRSIVEGAVDDVLGGGRSYSRRPSTKSIRGYRRVRPPYQFSPSHEMSAGMASFLGDENTAIKAVTSDMYGGDYDMLRYSQKKAFAKFVRQGKSALDSGETKQLKTIILTPNQLKAFVDSGMEVRQLKADMSDVVDQLGAILVPEDFRLDMIQRLPGLTVIRQHADVTPTGSDMMTRVKVTGGDDRSVSAVSVTWVGDVPASGDATTRPTFGVERTPIHICKATVRVPMALLEDTPFPLVQKLNEWVTAEFAKDEDEQFLIGTGIAKPQGILPDSANGVLGAGQEAISGSNSTLTFDGVIDLQYTIAMQYWAGCMWICNRGTAKVLRKLKDGEGNYLWEPNVQKDQPPMLLGFPVSMSEAMPDIAQNAYPLIYGNIKEGYQIADRVGMSVVRDEVTEAEADLVKFMFRRRLGGQVKAEWPLAVQKISAT
jgi:HK97 family phage major capsid protein